MNTNTSSVAESCAAATGSPSENHARKIPVVNVCTPKYATVPKSARVSISASAVPATIAGRASGSATRRKVPHGPYPQPRATSSMLSDCSRKAERARR
jgi:hypothetical protein